MVSTAVIEESIFQISGMNCEHCVNAVTEKVSALSGVESIVVDLGTGTATVRGEYLEPAAVIATIDDAGFDASVDSRQ